MQREFRNLPSRRHISAQCSSHPSNILHILSAYLMVSRYDVLASSLDLHKHAFPCSEMYMCPRLPPNVFGSLGSVISSLTPMAYFFSPPKPTPSPRGP